MYQANDNLNEIWELVETYCAEVNELADSFISIGMILEEANEDVEPEQIDALNGLRARFKRKTQQLLEVMQ
jgi:hypothetical protein